MPFLNIKVIRYGIPVFSRFSVHTYRDPLALSLFSMLLAAVSFVSVPCWGLGSPPANRFTGKGRGVEFTRNIKLPHRKRVR